MASITLGVNTPELCQNICQVRHIFIYSCWFWLKQPNFLFGIGAGEICKFSGRSYMCCHHLDPRVLSCLPSEVSDEKHTANIIGKSTKTNFRKWTFYFQIFWEQKLLPFVSQKLVSLSANLLSSFQKLSFFQWDFYPQLCHLFLNCQCHGVCWLCLWVNFCQTFQLSSVFKCPIFVLIYWITNHKVQFILNMSNIVQRQHPDYPYVPSKSRLYFLHQFTKNLMSGDNQVSDSRDGVLNSQASCLLLLYSRGMWDIRGQCSSGWNPHNWSHKKSQHIKGQPIEVETTFYYWLVGTYNLEQAKILLQILASVTAENECMHACEDFNLCTNYTFLGPENPLRWANIKNIPRVQNCPDITIW